MSSAWPELSYEGWKDTRDTLHRWLQIVGKIQLACTPRLNHFWNAGLLPSASGLRTQLLSRPDGAGSFDIEVDLLAHRLELRTDAGERRSFALEPMSVARFHERIFAAMNELGISVSILETPSEISVDAFPLDRDEQHASYDPRAVERFCRATNTAARMLQNFAGRFTGKQSPVLFWWGSFDLALSRYSGRPAPEREGADSITREAYSHEVSSAGFWPGDPLTPEAGFFAYTAPAPEHYADWPIKPESARFLDERGFFFLPWSALLQAQNPEEEALAFFESTYECGAECGDWPRIEIERAATVYVQPHPEFGATIH